MNSAKHHSEIDDTYVKSQGEQMEEKDLSEVLDKKEKIKSKMMDSNLLKKYAKLGKLMLEMLNDYRNGHYKKVPWLTVGSIIFALLYVLNPLDLFPDFIPGLGLMDDLSVFSITLKFVALDLDAYLDWKIKEE